MSERCRACSRTRDQHTNIAHDFIDSAPATDTPAARRGFTLDDVETIEAGVLALQETGCNLLAKELVKVAERVRAIATRPA